MAAGVIEQQDTARVAPEVERLHAILADLADLEGRATEADLDPDAVRIDQLALLERIKGAVAAAQARITAAFAQSQREQQAAAGVRRERRGRGIGDQIALACGITPSQGARRMGLARVLIEEMPHTMVLLTGGEISDWTATLLARETACLTRQDRAAVDARLCATQVDEAGELVPPPVLTMTPRRVVGATRALAAELDVEAVVRRRAHATSERRVWVRPAPDGMGWVTALVPMAEAVACFANLKKSADAAKAAGGVEHRTGAQLMADLFVERLTGQASAEAVPVEIGVVVGADTLIGESDQSGWFTDGTPCTADTARDLATQTDAPVWLRRWFTDPATGVTTSVDRARKRFFGGAELRFILIRDRHCRHPWCDASIEHTDHVVRVAEGGPTTVANGQGLCAAHNLTKETPGWSSRVVDASPSRHVVEITMPTGHTYSSNAPPALPP